MLTSGVVTIALLAGICAAQDEASMHSHEMGPAAFMWPPDRPWSAQAENTPPCGSSSGVGNRTAFPLTNGRLALITQNETRAAHIGVSYLNNPTAIEDFDIFYGPQQLDEVLDIGHTCVLAPSPPANVTAGSNATFMFFYLEENSTNSSPFWACTDIEYVETAAFDQSIPCFNATKEHPDVSTDGAVSVTTTAPDGSNPHPDMEDSDNGLSGGAIAGAVVGSIAGAALILIGAFLLWRRNRKSKAASEQSMQQMEKAMSDKSSR